MSTPSLPARWSEQAPHLTALDALAHLHWSVFPLDEEKMPPKTGGLHPNGAPKRLGWKAYQSRLPSREEVHTWHERYQPSAWAVITGAISGIVVLDFDGEAGRQTQERLRLAPHVQTGSGGHHVYFHHPGWSVPTLNSKSKHALGERWPGLDIRADGGYAVFCGRNRSGPYRWMREPVLEELAILPDDLRDFLGLLHAPETVQGAPGEKRSAASSPADLTDRLLSKYVAEALVRGRNNAGFDLACQLRDNQYGRHEAEALLREYAHLVPPTNMKGEIEEYTEAEALLSIESAYKKDTRTAWETYSPQPQGPAHGHHGSNGNGNHPMGRKSEEAPARGKQQKRELPTILIGRQSREVEEDMLASLLQADRDEPTLFVQSGRLVRLSKTELGRPIITQMNEAALRGKLTRAADFFRLKEKGDFSVKVPVAPPKDCIEDILNLAPADWPFPALEAIVETPVIRPDGTILDQPGYDPQTRLYYVQAAGTPACHVPARPSSEDVQHARTLIWETIGEFPYASQADQTNALALLMTPLLRPAIGGPVPMALLDAPKPGTGKGLFADLVSLVATGGHIAILTAPDTEEEWQKSITTLLLEGATVIGIDNISGRLQSGKLDAVLTCPDLWKGRILGVNRMALVPQRATWLATGNNLKLGGDLPRRCYSIRLDPRMSRPWERDQFTHEDLATWVKEHRTELIRALLILARAWFLAGKPQAQTPVMGSFKPWSRMVGSILAYAGEQGFLTNLTKLYDSADEESAEWEAFLRSWSAIWGEAWITTATIASYLDPSPTELFADSVGELSATSTELHLPEWLAVARKEKPISFLIRLGKALEKRVDECFGEENFRLERDQDKHSKGKLWRVVRIVRIVNPPILSSKNEMKSNIKIGGSDYPHYPHAYSENTRSEASTSGMTPSSPHAESAGKLSATHTLSAKAPQQLATEGPQCSTRWEKHKRGPHEARASVFSTGCWWCERCTPQRVWMEVGEHSGYPQVDVGARGFTIKAGREKWLRFAQEAGYALIEEVLQVVQSAQEVGPQQEAKVWEKRQDEEGRRSRHVEFL